MDHMTRVQYRKMMDRLRLVEEHRDCLLLEADTDSLTGLLNRRGLVRRTRGRDWGHFVAADLDGFKRAQDAHPDGHAYGDRILIEFTDFLLTNTRQDDMRAQDIMCSRIGGDEFMVWCETRVGAHRIRDIIRNWHSEDHQVTASAGIGRDTAAADAEMYMNKHIRKGI